MIEKPLDYAELRFSKIDDIQSESTKDLGKNYSLNVKIGEENGTLTYYILPYEGRPGGDAQLAILPYLDLRFEQEDSDGRLNEATDIAIEYCNAIIDGSLHLLVHKLGSITFKKEIVIGNSPKRAKGIFRYQVVPITLA
jgi:hypothetical protein